MTERWRNTCPNCGKSLDGITFDYGIRWECSKCATDQTDVLHCERGCKVQAVDLDAGMWGDSKQAHKFLTEGQIYEVESLHVGGWISSIQLKEFPYERFNTVHFKRYQESTNMQMETIKIRYMSDKIPPLEYIGGKSDWIDLRAAEDVELKSGDFKLIPLGIAMQLPKGFEAHIIPRSSTFKNFGVIQANHMGTIDESYCGDNDQWFFPAIALRDTFIKAGDRICQFRIVEHQPALHFKTVEVLGNTDRGGIGSTGKR